MQGGGAGVGEVEVEVEVKSDLRLCVCIQSAGSRRKMPMSVMSPIKRNDDRKMRQIFSTDGQRKSKSLMMARMDESTQGGRGVGC